MAADVVGALELGGMLPVPAGLLARLARAPDTTVYLHAAVDGVNALTFGERVVWVAGVRLRLFAEQLIDGLLTALLGEQAAALCNRYGSSGLPAGWFEPVRPNG